MRTLPAHVVDRRHVLDLTILDCGFEGLGEPTAVAKAIDCLGALRVAKGWGIVIGAVIAPSFIVVW